MGDARITPEPQLVSKLAKSLKYIQSPVRGKDLAELLAREEVRIIIDKIKSAQTRRDKDVIANDIQRIYDARLIGFVGSHQQQYDNRQGRQKYGSSHEESSARFLSGSDTLVVGQSTERTGQKDGGISHTGIENTSQQNCSSVDALIEGVKNNPDMLADIDALQQTEAVVVAALEAAWDMSMHENSEYIGKIKTFVKEPAKFSDILQIYPSFRFQKP